MSILEELQLNVIIISRPTNGYIIINYWFWKSLLVFCSIYTDSAIDSAVLMWLHRQADGDWYTITLHIGCHPCSQPTNHQGLCIV